MAYEFKCNMINKYIQNHIIDGYTYFTLNEFNFIAWLNRIYNILQSSNIDLNECVNDYHTYYSIFKNETAIADTIKIIIDKYKLNINMSTFNKINNINDVFSKYVNKKINEHIIMCSLELESESMFTLNDIVYFNWLNMVIFGIEKHYRNYAYAFPNKNYDQ